MNVSKKQLRSNHVQQLGEFACGIACLSTISKYYGRSISQEKIRETSGTTLIGTTLLGLYNAAQMLKFEAKGYEADINQLKSLDSPVILHVLLDGIREHFVVCYGMENDCFIISDPGLAGITEYTEDELLFVWKSKYLLSLKPSKDFSTTDSENYAMWDWFKSLITKDIPILSVAAVIGIIIAIFNLSTAIFAQKLIDDFLPNQENDKILIGFLALTFLLIARSFLGLLRGIFMARQGRDLSLRIVRSFINKLIRLPISIVKGYGTGDLIARMNDSMRIRSTVSLVTGDLLISIMVVLISCVYIFYLSLVTGAVTLTSIVFFLVIGWRYSPRIHKSQRDLMNAHAINESTYIDALTGLPIIKSYNKEENFEYSVNRSYEYYQNKGYELELLSSRFGFFIQTLTGLYLSLIFGIGVWQVVKGNLLLGELMALVTAGGTVIPSLASLIMANVSLQGARVAFQRMYEISSLEPEYSENRIDNLSTFTNNKLLNISDLTFRFPGESPIIQSLNLELEKGQIVTLFGQIGSGKSTLVDIFQRFYKPESGEISLFGQLQQNWPIKDWRDRMGVVRQDEKIFNSTILDNICLSRDPDEVTRSTVYLEEIGLAKYFYGFPQGFMTLCGEGGKYLSGGQKQLVTLARAVNKRPDFLILDESTSAMDFETESKVIDILKNLVKSQKVGIMMLTHRMGLAMMSDRIYLLESGSIKKFGSHSELLTDSNLYSRIYHQLVGNESFEITKF